MRRENNLFEAILYSESWKINFVINKYILFITNTQRNISIWCNPTVKKHIDCFEYHQQELIYSLKSNLNTLHLGHFLPEYFSGDDLKKINFNFEFEAIDAVFKKISGTSDLLPAPSDFIMKDLGREINLKGENQKELIKNLILKKLKRT